MDWVLILFLAVQVVGVLAFIDLWRSDVPIARPTMGPRYIFRLVKRDERAVYVRIQRRTMAVAMRDMSRAFKRMGREIGKVLLPTIQRFADAINSIGKPPAA